jgi:hypothetical protein
MLYVTHGLDVHDILELSCILRLSVLSCHYADFC